MKFIPKLIKFDAQEVCVLVQFSTLTYVLEIYR